MDFSLKQCCWRNRVSPPGASHLARSKGMYLTQNKQFAPLHKPFEAERQWAQSCTSFEHELQKRRRVGTCYIPPGRAMVLCDWGALGDTSSQLRPPGVLRHKGDTSSPQLCHSLPLNQPGVATFRHVGCSQPKG